MDTLVAHPHRSHYATMPYPSSSSASSSYPPPHPSHQQHPHPHRSYSHHSHPSSSAHTPRRYDSQPIPSSSHLQISTDSSSVLMQQMHAEPDEETAHPNRVPQSISSMGSVPAMGSLTMPPGIPGMMMSEMDLAMSSLGMNGMDGMGGIMDASSMLAEPSENVSHASALNTVLDSSSTAPDSNHSHSQPQDHTSVPGEPSRSQPQPQSSTSSALNALAARGIDGLSMTELADLSIAGSGDSIGSSFPGLGRALTHGEKELLSHLDRLKFFLATAPSRWSAEGAVNGDPPLGHPSSTHPALNRFLLPNNEYVSCVLWGGLYHITGTDIVRALVFRFEAFGRPVRNMKKFEEGVFSDLRNLKPGVDACLEEPKSPFLDLLFKYQCIRTQKKQKVFYWFSVPHDRLFLDALERDLKREKMGQESTTEIVGEPARSFTYDPKRSLYDQFSKAQGAMEGEGELEAAVRRADEAMSTESSDGHTDGSKESDAEGTASEHDESGAEDGKKDERKKANLLTSSPFFSSMFSLFEGSPTYKQRRKKVTKSRRSPSSFGAAYPAQYYGASGITAPGDYMYNMRMQEPQIDRYGRDTSRMSAAEMFTAQARGDFGPQSNPDLVAPQKERQRRAMVAHAERSTMHSTFSSGSGIDMAYQAQQQSSRPHIEQRHTYPLLADHGFPSRSNTDPSSSTLVSSVDSSSSFDPNAPPMGWPNTTPVVDSDPMTRTTKVYVCGLYSCGRMFKRMEHLKRHMRIHTMERPFACTACDKKFARKDNLNQHLRTHQRDGMDDYPHAESGSRTASPEGDGYDEGSFPYMDNIPNGQIYELELTGAVEVQGDEEGLVVAAGSTSINTVDPHAASGPLVDPVQDMIYNEGSIMSDSPNAQWVALPGSHPAQASPSPFIPGPSTGSRVTPSSSYGSSSMDHYLSASAPPHKVAFDHSALYPPDLGGASSSVGSTSSLSSMSSLSSTGGGPVRRHRSATPNIGRYDGHPRRPYSAALSDHGSSRGSSAYHPYAAPMMSASAESSPLQYQVQLDYDGHPLPQPHHPYRGHAGRSGAHSRSSSTGGQLQDQMDHMLSIESSGYTQDATGPVQVQGYTDIPMYNRTDSPMQYTTGSEEESRAAQVAAVQNMYLGMGDPQAMTNVAVYPDGTYMSGYGHSAHM